VLLLACFWFVDNHTVFVNSSLLDGNYRLHNLPIVFDLPKK
jgi:hypothetical protein